MLLSNVTATKFKGEFFIHDFQTALETLEIPVSLTGRLWNETEVREVWSLWLLCIALNQMGGNYLFAEQKRSEGDGLLWDKKTNNILQIENISALNFKNAEKKYGKERILEPIRKKSYRKAYKKNTILTVFFDGAKKYFPNEIAKDAYKIHPFMEIYAIGLLNDKYRTQYSYSVMKLNKTNTECVIIEIAPRFKSWEAFSINDPRARKYSALSIL